MFVFFWKSHLIIQNTEIITNMKKVEIDGDTADRIVVCSLEESMLTLRYEISKLKKKKNLTKWEKAELCDCIISLDHLQKTYSYYGGDMK